MKLSVVVVTWNTAKITLRCLKSLHRYLPKAQIVVVDNGSTDNTRKLIAADKSVTYVNAGSNLGFAKGNNLGVSQCTGDYLLFLNSDMELIDNSLETMFEYYKKHPSLGIIGPRFLNPDLTPQASVFPPQTPLNALGQYWFNKPVYEKYLPGGVKPQPVWALSGGCLLIKKDLFLSVGGWNEKYFMYFEDLDLCRKIRKLSKDIIYYPSASVIHRHGASGQLLADSQNQWRRLIPGSKLYHGLLEHYLIFVITWSAQKFRQLFSRR